MLAGGVDRCQGRGGGAATEQGHQLPDADLGAGAGLQLGGGGPPHHHHHHHQQQGEGAGDLPLPHVEPGHW